MAEASPFVPGGFDTLLDSIKRQAAYPLDAVIPGVRVSAHQRDPDEGARVTRDDPSNIQINTDARVKYPQLLMHEFEHVLQNNVGERYGNSYDMEVMKEAKKLGLTTENIISSLRNAGGSAPLRKRIEELGGQPSAYIGKIPDGRYSLREQWADLSAIEQHLHKDLTQDPVVRKEMFSDNPELVRLYKATTGLRTNRLDAKDLPPMTVPPVAAPPTAVQLSLADRAMQMLKNPFKGPQ